MLACSNASLLSRRETLANWMNEWIGVHLHIATCCYYKNTSNITLDDTDFLQHSNVKPLWLNLLWLLDYTPTNGQECGSWELVDSGDLARKDSANADCSLVMLMRLRLTWASYKIFALLGFGCNSVKLTPGLEWVTRCHAASLPSRAPNYLRDNRRSGWRSSRPAPKWAMITSCPTCSI